MASTYVNDLRLNEMATGDASGSWGTVTNTNLELIGEAFSYGTETIGDADSTLTIADGAADAARSFYLKITSSVDLTTTRIVTLGPNTVSKVWMIENATTGSQVITIKQGSGATINVPNGQVKMISTDGAGSGGAVLDLLVDVDLTGTTTLVNLDVSGAVDIDGATQIDATVTVGVDDTGYDVKFFGATTGKSLLWDESADSLIVTGTTTLVGTTNLDAVDIDGATQIDATVTVGVDDTGYDVKFFGATAGAYMLWDESADDLILGGAAGLSVNSTALVTGVLTTTAATVSNGGGQFNGAINVGVDDTGYDVKFFGATAGKYMLWDESADTLEVSGTVVAAAGTALLPSITTTGDLNTGMWFPAADTIAFSEGGVEALRINSSGDVGIGTGSPVTFGANTHGLTLNGTAAGQHISFQQSDSYKGSLYQTDDTIILASEIGEIKINSAAGVVINEGGADVDFRVESSGNVNMLFVDGGDNRVGIGATPQCLFAIQDATTPELGFYRTSGATSGLLGRITMGNTDIDSGMGGIEFNQDGATTSSRIGFFTQPAGGASTERLRIDSVGKIQISNDIPIWSGSYGGAVFLKGNNATAARNARLCIVDSTGAQDGNKELILDNDGDVTVKGGDLIFGTAGKGIVLGATTNVAANTLDDYEEGTFTPTITAATGTLTTVSATGAYTKVGRLVTASVDITVTTNGTGAGNLVTTLPFTPSSLVQYGTGREVTAVGFTITIQTGGSNAIIVKASDDVYPAGNGYRLKGSVTYSV
jgi:hypothetical protein